MDKYIVLITVIGIVAFYYFFSRRHAQKNIQLGSEYLVENRQQEGVAETESGLQYKLLEKGEGTQHPTAKDTVTVHYHGTLLDGSVFDSSVDRGPPISFALNQVIPGWTEGLQLMVVGDKMRFFIPSKLAYGNRRAGKIAPGSVLVFDVKLLEINN